jgi:hypothetical protein
LFVKQVRKRVQRLPRKRLSTGHAIPRREHDLTAAPLDLSAAFQRRQRAVQRAGKGMALALPAELNGYPGPAHVLELAGPLGLSDDQQRATLALFEQMQAEAKALGEQVITEERALDRLFRDQRADSASVREATARAAGKQGELRAAHLDYHLLMMAVLTPRQVARYMELRGYR